MFSPLLAMLLCCCVTPAVAADFSAWWDGSDLVITGRAGARIKVFDATEKPVAGGRVGEDGQLRLRGQGRVDPMLRLVSIDGKVGALSALFPAAEITAVLPAKLSAGLPLTPHVRLLGRHLGKPMAGLDVNVRLTCGKKVYELGNFKTDERGVAALGSETGTVVPSQARGSCSLEATAAGALVRQTVQITRGAQLVVSTDRPVYQPGHTIAVRGLALDLGTSKPIARGKALLELLDTQSNVVGRKRLKTSEFGLVNAGFKVADGYTMPKMTLRMTLGGATATKTVKVGRYRPPQLTVEVDPTQPAYEPGDELAVRVRVARLDGGPTEKTRVELTAHSAGKVVIRRTARTDREGFALLRGRVPDEASGLSLSVRAETPGGRVGNASRDVAIDDGRIGVWAVPESGYLVPGVINGVWIVTQRPDGTPVEARLTVVASRKRVRGATAKNGIGFVRVPLGDRTPRLEVTAQAGKRRGMRAVDVGGRGGKALLHLDRTVAGAAETVNATLLAPGSDGTVAVFDLVQGDHAVASRTAPMRAGSARVTFEMPSGPAGTIRVHGWTLANNRVVGDARLMLVDDPRDLRVELKADQETYRPREEATVHIRVVDGAGRPVSAALGLTAVDKGLKALGLEQPGVEQALARLGARWDKPVVEVPKWARTALFEARDRQRLGVLASAANAAVRLPAPQNTQARRAFGASHAFRPAVERRTRRIAKALTKYYGRSRSRRDKKVGTARLIATKVLDRRVLKDPWGRPLKTRLEIDKSCCRAMVVVTSSGVDGKHKTPDDIETRARFDNFHKRLCACMARIAMGRHGVGGLGMRGVGYGGAGHAVGFRKLPTFRSEFPETLAVEPALITDEDGRASWRVRLADSLTTWLVQARAVSRVGGLGGGHTELHVEQPFSVDVSLPASLTRKDAIDLPVSVTNRSRSPQTVELKARAGGALQGELIRSVEVPAQATRAVLLPVQAREAGEGWIEVQGNSASLADAVRRKVVVDPGGMPVAQTVSGAVVAGAETAMAMAVESGGIEGTRHVKLRLYPSALGAAVEGLESLIAAPHGCFEQTSATTYPNALVLDYLKGRTLAPNPEVTDKARAFLKAGWTRLIGYEVEGGGFSWFGNAPANKILTAFGVMEFEKMGTVMKVDPKVAERTRTWLMAQRRPDGAWDPDKSYLHAESWSTIQNSALPVTAYITWALARTGTDAKGLEKSVAWLIEHADQADDPYILALVAVALTTADPTSPESAAARTRLLALSETTDKGRQWKSKTSTATFSTGISASLETTALATIALMTGRDHPTEAQQALDYLLTKRRPGGGWPTTQSTVLALDALLQANASTKEATGTLTIKTPTGLTTQHITAQDYDVVRTIALPSSPGRLALKATLKGQGALQYQLSATRNVPAAPTNSPLTLTLQHPQTATQNTPIQVTLNLKTTTPVRMPTIQVSIPAGFDLDPISHPAIQKHETLGRHLTLYLARLTPATPLNLTYTMTPRRTGTLNPGPSRAWPYYNPDQTTWLEPAPVHVTP